MLAFATASAAASNTASAEWTYLLVMLCVLWPSKRGDRRLVVAEVGGETGEAVAQHMRRDVGRQITELGDPQPHLPIADDRSRRIDWRTPYRRSSAGR